MKIIISIFALLISFSGYSQELKSSKSLAIALSLSAKAEKPVLLIVNLPKVKPTKDVPKDVRANFKSALNEKDVIAKIDQNFTVYETTMIDTSVRSIIRLGNIKRFPAYIFIRQNKEIFFTDFGNSTDKKKYLLMVDNALAAYKEKSISELEKDVETNDENISLIKKLIESRKKIGITNNADLIEKYASNLKIADFNNYENVLYILESGPYADGIAYKMIQNDRKLIDSFYKTEPLQRRVAVNNSIITNTMIAAAKEKKLSRAMAGANFARSTWTRDYRAGEKAFNNQILWYYSTVKDTANYIRTATYFYDSYYMNISVDSIKKIEARNHKANIPSLFPDEPAVKMVSKEKMDSLMKSSAIQKITTQSIIAVTSSSSSYAMELNNAAWKFYEIGTKNINHLTKAMIWSRRSIELNPFSGYYDTLAHILYRMGYYDEAAKTQEIAIEKARAEKRSVVSFQSELKKIKSKSL
jgi:tetratricopeptide (TPR) repeat protein